MTIFGTSGRDEMDGGPGQDIFDGLGGGDEFRGERGNDIFYGRSGDDWMYYEAGNDTFYGGNGFDRVDYRDGPGAIHADLKTGRITDGGGFTDQVYGVERVIGSQFNDRIYGNARDNGLTGEAGNDTIDGRGGFDTVWYGREESAVRVNLALEKAVKGTGRDKLYNLEGIGGSNFSDRLIGDDKNNFFTPDQEDDRFTPNYQVGGDDFVNGGAGFDTVGYYNAVSGVVVNLATGQATDGRKNTDTLKNIEGLIGSSFDDELIGSDAENHIRAGAGDDEIRGLKGADRLEGGAGADLIRGNQGGDRLAGDGGKDELRGGGGEDTLFGGSGDDRLFGGVKSDVLAGGRGDDTLSGEAGADRFVFRKNGGADVVKDFQDGKDMLDLMAFGFNSFADLRDLERSVDGGTLIDLTDHSGGSILLQQIAPGLLDAGDVIL